jgi:hypothetical protein
MINPDPDLERIERIVTSARDGWRARGHDADDVTLDIVRQVAEFADAGEAWAVNLLTKTLSRPPV